jgi:S1-C subfamily serine protease
VNETNPFPGAAPEPVTDAAAPLPTPRRRRTGVIAAGTVGALGVAAAAVFGVHAATSGTTVVGQASPAQGVNVPAGWVPYGRGDWSTGGTTGGDTTGGNTTGTATSTGTAATAAQTVGIVTIDTVLQYQNAAAAGTGMILTSNGEILTNNHVVDGATSIKVTVESTGATYTATVVGTDPTDDVAVLQLSNASGLKTAKLATAAAAVGESVTGVGNAGGTGTLTAATGTVTALDQDITASDDDGGNAEQLTGLIETNAAIQAGDSGGPLYGSSGAVIGMDTAASSGGQAEGYAIPIATAVSIAKQIESGVDNSTIHQGLPAFLGISVEDGGNGATVGDVVSGGAADTAGLAAGDVITAIGGTTITSASDLTTAMAGYDPGDRATVTWTTADGTSQSATVTFGTGPAD